MKNKKKSKIHKKSMKMYYSNISCSGLFENGYCARVKTGPQFFGSLNSSSV